jgi:hypothetical protein
VQQVHLQIVEEGEVESAPALFVCTHVVPSGGTLLGLRVSAVLGFLQGLLDGGLCEAGGHEGEFHSVLANTPIIPPPVFALTTFFLTLSDRMVPSSLMFTPPDLARFPPSPGWAQPSPSLGWRGGRHGGRPPCSRSSWA